MADNTRTLSVRWVTDTTGITKGAAQASKGIGSIASSLTGMVRGLGAAGGALGSVGQIATGVFTAGAITNGIESMARGIAEVTRVALEDQKTQQLLATTLRENVKGATDDTITSVENFIHATSDQTGVLDTELRPAFQSLIRSTHDVAGAESLMKTALDVSAGTGRDLSQVTLALARAQGGSYTILRRLIPTIDIAKAKTEGMTYVQRQLNAAFGGDAQVAAQSTAGKLQILSERWHTLEEELGKAVLPAVDITATALTRVSDAADGAGISLGSMLKGAAIGTISPALGIASTVIDRIRGNTDRYATSNDNASKAQDRLNKAVKAYADDQARVGTTEAKLSEDKSTLVRAQQDQETITAAVNAAIDEGTNSSIDNAAATKAQAQATKDAEQAAKDAERAQKDYTDAVTGSRDAALAMATTQITLTGDLDSYNKSAEAAAKAGYHNKDANDAWQKSAITVEGDILDVAKNASNAAEQADKLAGKTFTARDAADAQRVALTKLRDGLAPTSPFRQYINGLIGDLDKLAQPRAGSIDYSVFVNGKAANIAPSSNPAAAALRLSTGGKIAFLQHGGFVEGPPGAPVPAVVHGGEYVVSRDELAGRGTASGGPSPIGAHSTYNIVQHIAPGADPVAVGRATVDAIRAYERSNGKSWRS